MPGLPGLLEGSACAVVRRLAGRWGGPPGRDRVTAARWGSQPLLRCLHTVQVLLMFGPEYARACGIAALEPLGIFLPGDKNYPGAGSAAARLGGKFLLVRAWLPCLLLAISGVHELAPPPVPNIPALSNLLAGGWLFDPLNLSSDAKRYEAMRVREIKNGRLAMVAWLGFAAQAAVTRQGPLQNFIDALGSLQRQ